jgi:tRNA (guanine26-N2/guanine27-N2)-dimethyltransferase
MKYAEGLIEINAGKKGLIPKKTDEIFLNEHKKFDRDMTILLLNSLGWKNKTCMDLMAASGIRGLRIAKETNCFNRIILNDSKKSAVSGIKKNIALNGLKNCEVFNLDAYELLKNHDGRIDYLDIDPFGSPIYFIADAAKKLSRGGILGICATDTGALSGTFPKTCKRRYHSNSYLSEFYYESGIRILIKECINIASTYDIALEPIFCHATRHYFRAYFRKIKGAKIADELIKKIDYISYCPKCLHREIGIMRVCACKEKPMLIGPLFVGQLFDKNLADKMKGLGEYADFFGKISEEISADVPWFYTTDSVCKKYNLGFEPKLKDLGYFRTHITPKGFKTKHSIAEIVGLFKDKSLK